MIMSNKHFCLDIDDYFFPNRYIGLMPTANSTKDLRISVEGVRSCPLKFKI